MGEVVPPAVKPPGLLVTVYPEIGDPPSLAGTAKPTVALPSNAVATTEPGADGAVNAAAGVTELVASDGGPSPATFEATTVNVYEVPLARPPTVIGEVNPLTLTLPGLLVTVYPVTDAPPSLAGAAKLTIAVPSPAVALTLTGAEGAVGGVEVEVGVTGSLAAEAVPVPTAFVARTVNVYDVPLVSPLTVMGVVVPTAEKPPGLLVTV